MDRHWKLMIAALFAVLSLAFAACGDDDDASPTPTEDTTADASASPGEGDEETPTPDEQTSPTSEAEAACDLLTEAEAEDALGSEIVQTAIAAGNCTFIAEDSSSVSVATAQLGEDPETEFEAGRVALGGEAVDGIGDEAFWTPGLNQLQVRVGTDHLFVTVVTVAEGDDPIDAATDLAEIALGRLE